jgi:hypothetical protein
MNSALHLTKPAILQVNAKRYPDESSEAEVANVDLLTAIAEKAKADPDSKNDQPDDVKQLPHGRIDQKAPGIWGVDDWYHR